MRSHLITLDRRTGQVHQVLEACHRTWRTEHINGLYHCRASPANSLEPESYPDEKMGIDSHVDNWLVVSLSNLPRLRESTKY